MQRAVVNGCLIGAVVLVVFLAGGALVAFFLRRQREPAAPPEAPGEGSPRLAPVDTDLERQVEEEMRQSSGGSW